MSEAERDTSLIDDILSTPRRKKNHPGGSKGRGTRGGQGRDERQIKCACSTTEHEKFTQALRAEYDCHSVSRALRTYLIRLAKKHELLADTYAED